MQTQAMTGTYYKGMVDCIQTVWKTEGVKAFYRGIAAPMSSYGARCRAATGGGGDLGGVLWVC
jgi:hypothetical protein